MTATTPDASEKNTMINTVRQSTPIPFGRLVAIETRKLFDTTTNKILALVVIAMTIGLIVVRGILAGPDVQRLFGTTTLAYATVLPVLGILSVTSEWSHRTALTTFALEPRRARVLLAKCVPPVLTAIAATAFALLITLPTAAVIAQVQDVPVSWNLELLPTLGRAATNVLLVAVGLGLGMLLLNAPAAIVIALSSVMGWSIVGLMGSFGRTLREWLDINSTTGPLADADFSAGDLARLAVSVAFWIIIPITVGILRVQRKEVH